MGNGGVNIVRISVNAVVKYGYDVKLWEARNMIFVAKNTTIRLPQVFDAWVEYGDGNFDDETSMCFIVMSYIDGLLLVEAWPKLWDARRDDIQQHYTISYANSAKPRANIQGQLAAVCPKVPSSLSMVLGLSPQRRKWRRGLMRDLPSAVSLGLQTDHSQIFVGVSRA